MKTIRFDMDPYRAYAEKMVACGELYFEIERVRHLLMRIEKMPLANRADQRANVYAVTQMFRALLSAKEIREKAAQNIR